MRPSLLRRAPCVARLALAAIVVAAVFLIASAPASAAEPAALAQEIRDGAQPGIVAMVATRGDTTLADAQAPDYDPAGVDIRSATKSITALLVGIALDRDLIPSLDAPVADLLPEYADALRADPDKARISVRDLLTMRSGLDCDDWNPQSPGHEDRMYRKRDWLAFWAALPMRETPGERFSYCTGNVIALGRIVEVASGRSLPDFAQEALFAPLDIHDARWALWKRDTRTDSGGHLRLSTKSLGRIGRLLLDRGMAGGTRVVGAAWLDAMTAEHTNIPGRAQRYGYLWWVDATTDPTQPRLRLWMAMGNGGNLLIVVPELDAVVAFAGVRYNRADALEPLLWMRDRLLPALRAGR